MFAFGLGGAVPSFTAPLSPLVGLGVGDLPPSPWTTPSELRKACGRSGKIKLAVATGLISMQEPQVLHYNNLGVRIEINTNKLGVLRAGESRIYKTLKNISE